MKILKRILVLFIFLLFAFFVAIVGILQIPIYIFTGKEIINDVCDSALLKVLQFNRYKLRI